MAIIGYVRVSSDKQRDEGDSLDAQRNLILDRYPDADIHVEVESAKDIEHRQVLQGLIGALQRGDVLVVKHIDRMARSSLDMLQTVDYFAREGINFVSLENQIDTTTAEGKFMLTVLSAVAQLERDLTSRRTKTVIYNKQRKGEKTVGLMPYGYDTVEIGRTVRDTPIYKLVENDEEQKRLLDIIKARNEGISYNAIAKELNRMSVPTKTGKRWHASTIAKLIKNNGKT